MSATITDERARELAKAWVFWRDVGITEAPEFEDLLSWVRARMAAEVRNRQRIADMVAMVESRAGLHAVHINHFDLTGDDREALANAVGHDLGLSKGDGTKATASAWALCVLAGWPS